MSSSDNEYLFTSESVTEGHPDKVSDQISDGVLDACLTDDPYSRVACETLVNTGLVVVSGEITTNTYVDIQEVARETIRKIGYIDADLGFSADSCAVLNAIDKQSADIAQGVDQADEARSEGSSDELDIAGAGDQGMMFGYASNETSNLMPLPITLAHQLAERLAAVRHDNTLDYLRPVGKTQVSVRYVDGRPVSIEKLLISTQHREDATRQQITDDLWENVVLPVLPEDMFDADALRKEYVVYPTRRFDIGGPCGADGLTGRKCIDDSKGGLARP
jgi:S-adenosylmethionine synthetase